MEWTRVMEWVRVWGNKSSECTQVKELVRVWWNKLGQMSWLGFEGTSRVKESLRLMERVRPNELVRVWWKELVRVWWNQWARVDGMNEWMNTLRWKSWSRLMCWSRLMEQVRVMCWSRLMCGLGWWNKSGWCVGQVDGTSQGDECESGNNNWEQRKTI